jgi:tRNA pseudouridine55 synthase
MPNIFSKDRTPDFEAGEILIIDKPLKWSSFDVVNKVRYKLRGFTGNRNIKVGHAGTLDPLASGVLVLCTGKATKIIDSIQADDKVYEAIFRIGATTPSYDMEKEIDQTFDYQHITNEQIINCINSFSGKSFQTPPIFSAIQIDGKRAYEYARKGKEVKIEKREIFISNIEVTKIELPEVYVNISCSKGTYIRTLANDFGKALDNGAFLCYLRRIRSGIFGIEDAIELKEFDEILNNL